MVFALATVGFGQSVSNFNITEKIVLDAQKTWRGALVQILDLPLFPCNF